MTHWTIEKSYNDLFSYFSKETRSKIKFPDPVDILSAYYTQIPLLKTKHSLLSAQNLPQTDNPYTLEATITHQIDHKTELFILKDPSTQNCLNIIQNAIPETYKNGLLYKAGIVLSYQNKDSILNQSMLLSDITETLEHNIKHKDEIEEWFSQKRRHHDIITRDMAEILYTGDPQKTEHERIKELYTIIGEKPPKPINQPDHIWYTNLGLTLLRDCLLWIMNSFKELPEEKRNNPHLITALFEPFLNADMAVDLTEDLFTLYEST